MKNLATLDADETLFPEFSIFPIFDAFEADGFVSRTQNAQVQDVLAQYTSNVIDYSTFMSRALTVGAAVLTGKSVAHTEQVAMEAFAAPDYPWFGYVQPTLADLRDDRFKLVLLTGEPAFVAKGISRALDLDTYFSSEFLADDGCFTGRVDTDNILSSKKKGEITRLLRQDADRTVGFGDSEGDADMLDAIQAAYCINPTPGLRTIALAKGWNIIDNPNQAISLVRIH